MTWYVYMYKRKRVVCLCVRELWGRDRQRDRHRDRETETEKQTESKTSQNSINAFGFINRKI